VAAATTTPAPDKPAAPAAPVQAAAGSSNPRQACENRMLLGFQICMNEQCAKSAFANHPVCVERRAMDKLRQEVRDGRN
jgi:serine/threonine-protein kinase